MRTSWSLLGVAALAASAALAQRPVASPAGFVVGDGVYRIESEAVQGDGALLTAESVSTNYFPARLHLWNGAFAILGVGSQASVFEDRIKIRGVSFEMLRFGQPPLPIAAAGLMIHPRSPDARVSLFTDRPEEVSVMVSKGEAEVRSSSGRMLRRMPTSSVATFTSGPGEIRIQEGRFALESARICLRQLEMLAALEERSPGLAPRRRAMVDSLLAASGEAFAPHEGQRSGAAEALEGLPDVSSQELLAALRDVHFRLNQEGLDEAGCADPECAAEDPPRWRDRFFGRAFRITPPPPGCALCQLGASDEP